MLVVPCGWLLVKWHQVSVKLEAVAAIEKAGGSVGDGDPHGPEWLRKLMGDGWFTEVEEASCGSLTTDADLEHLKGLTQLHELRLANTRITDAGLEHLKGLAQLRWLSLSETRITDAGLQRLKGLGQLRGLGLAHTRITDAGLEHLKWLPKLDQLWLRGTKVTDAAVTKFQRALPRCTIWH